GEPPERHPVGLATESPEIVSHPRLLHLDDLRPELPAERGAHRRRAEGREIQDDAAVERRGRRHRLPPPHRRASRTPATTSKRPKDGMRYAPAWRRRTSARMPWAVSMPTRSAWSPASRSRVRTASGTVMPGTSL